MYRRSYLALGLTASLAGCSDVVGGFLESKEYEQSDEPRMIPGLEIFPPGWIRDDEFNDNFDAVFMSEDEDVIVMMSADVHEKIEDAKNRFDRAKERSDSNEFTLADEAIWADRGDNALAIFRHSNAIGQSLGARESGLNLVPDVGRATQYADEMYAHWQDL